MVKVQPAAHDRPVVIGWRERKAGGAVASLILALYDTDGELRHVGHTSGFTAKRARELLDVVAPLETGEHGEPGPSRWTRRARDRLAQPAAGAGLPRCRSSTPAAGASATARSCCASATTSSPRSASSTRSTDERARAARDHARAPVRPALRHRGLDDGGAAAGRHRGAAAAPDRGQRRPHAARPAPPVRSRPRPTSTGWARCWSCPATTTSRSTTSPGGRCHRWAATGRW